VFPTISPRMDQRASNHRPRIRTPNPWTQDPTSHALMLKPRTLNL